MTKKYISFALFILSSIILLSPLNTLADSFAFWKVPYKNTNYNSYDSLSHFFGSQGTNLNGLTEYTTTIYFNDAGFNINTYDKFEVQFAAVYEGSSITSGACSEYSYTNDNYFLFYNTMSLSFQAFFENNASPYYETQSICSITSRYSDCNQFVGVLTCNVPRVAYRLDRISVKHSLRTSGTYTFFFGTDGWFNMLYKDDTGSIANAINSQTSALTTAQQNTTNAINNVNSSINNSSTTDANSSGSSFFSGFQTESFGHLTDIITAPLSLFSAMTSTTCNPITLNVDFSDSTNGSVGSKNVVLPCGTTLFWENSSLGSKVSNFRTFWNILLGAPLIYGCLLLLVKAIDSALDPLNDELITLNVSKNDDKRIEKIQKQDELKKQARGGS